MKKPLLLIAAVVLTLLVYQCTEEKDADIISGKDGSGELYSTDGFGGGYGLDGGSGSYGGGVGSGNGDSLSEPLDPGQITAAEWNDLASWDFWASLGQNEFFNSAMDRWNFYPEKRYSFILKDSKSDPVIDCPVILKNVQGDVLWSARTDNEGKAELWLNLYGGTEDQPLVEIKYNAEEMTIVNPRLFEEGINEVMLNSDAISKKNVDITFVVDATGSMGDEIEYLKAELLDVLEKSAGFNAQLALRTASVFYRDEGDEYLTKVSPFSAETDETLSFINQQHADGGGDYEEAVHTALNTALDQLSWSSNARARLLFLVLDAPPHFLPHVVNEIGDALAKAAEKGIKIIPVSASGIDKDTEFLFRFFSVATNGTYVFITNDSGIGGEHIEATVGEYEVELLNELIVRLINQYTK
jgi:hypothetical protein